MNATIATVALLLTVLFLPSLVAVPMVLTPWLTDRREVFGVTVPPVAHRDQRIRTLKTGYLRAVVGADAACVVCSFAAWLLAGATGALWAAGMATVLVAVLAVVAQQACRRKVMTVKRERGWVADGDLRAAAVAETAAPEPLGFGWESLQAVALAVTTLVGVLGYDRMPDCVPMHMDLAGHVDSWAVKSPAVIWYPVLVQLVMATVMVVCHAVLLRSRRPVDPERPASSAYAYGVYARAWSVYLVVVGLLVAAAMGLGFQLSLIGVVGAGTVGVLLALVAVVAVVGAIGMGVRYGQNGSRVFDEDDGDAAGDGDGGGTMPRDDDRYWIGGVIYWNRDDPAVIVPKRFGIGWTCNFARPGAWAGIAALLVVIIGMPVVFALL
ncbi:DUF1648 domain-containing protein [Bifidobacterium stellenboschense]|uniref:Membrane protein n=1 Tax=Bifidobacterium stellenboschense TaxID=762211 RepID=A0A087DZK3_9BIFI|nr:DUF5808 domain-containing protein [Bifidobacterium stellenboschense]KFJ00954.1 membrane protein [Bifidobacterium stellenboschense]